MNSMGAASTPVVDRNLSSNAVKKWILPGERPSIEAWICPTKNRLRVKSGAVFSTMMLDSSSEDEGGEFNEDEDAINESDVSLARNPNVADDLREERNKKKRKRKANKKPVKI